MNRRRGWRLLMGVGEATSFLGGLAVCAGAALPWAAFTLFRLPIVLPGLLVGGGFTAAAAACGIFLLRRVPILTIVFGLIALYLGFSARASVGTQVVRTLIRVNLAFMPLNSRLAQAGFAGIDPAPGINPARTYLGIGINCTLLGATALTLGAVLRVGAERLSRRCTACGYVWRVSRDKGLHFCPRCGVTVLPAGTNECRTCRHPIFRSDRFCTFCGTAVAVGGRAGVAGVG